MGEKRRQAEEYPKNPAANSRALVRIKLMRFKHSRMHRDNRAPGISKRPWGPNGAHYLTLPLPIPTYSPSF
jgi:hypothetical protein